MLIKTHVYINFCRKKIRFHFQKNLLIKKFLTDKNHIYFSKEFSLANTVKIQVVRIKFVKVMLQTVKKEAISLVEL